jgi:hypothetical protein
LMGFFFFEVIVFRVAGSLSSMLIDFLYCFQSLNLHDAFFFCKLFICMSYLWVNKENELNKIDGKLLKGATIPTFEIFELYLIAGGSTCTYHLARSYHAMFSIVLYHTCLSSHSHCNIFTNEIYNHWIIARALQV